MEPDGPAPAFEDVVVAIDGLVRSIKPDAVAWGEGVVSQGYALPDDPVPFVLVRVAQTGVDVFVRADSTDPYIGTFTALDDVGWADFEHALRVAVASAEVRSTPRPRVTDSFRGFRGDSALPAAAFTVGGYFAFDAVRWQRVGILALLPWAVIAVTIGIVVALVFGVTDANAPGASPLPGILGLVIGIGGWALTVRWAYRRFPPTAEQRAAATSADSEFLRTNSRALGCVAGGAWVFLCVGVLEVLGSEAGRGLAGQVAGVVILVGFGVIPVVTFRYIRRHYPPGPESMAVRLTDVLLLVLLLIAVAVGLYAVIATTPSG